VRSPSSQRVRERPCRRSPLLRARRRRNRRLAPLDRLCASNQAGEAGMPASAANLVRSDSSLCVESNRVLEPGAYSSESSSSSPSSSRCWAKRHAPVVAVLLAAGRRQTCPSQRPVSELAHDGPLQRPPDLPDGNSKVSPRRPLGTCFGTSRRRCCGRARGSSSASRTNVTSSFS
jgi:hypothetical protein